MDLYDNRFINLTSSFLSTSNHLIIQFIIFVSCYIQCIIIIKLLLYYYYLPA